MAKNTTIKKSWEMELCKQFLNLRKKLQKNIMDLNFLLKCKRLNIIPKFLRINTTRNNNNFYILQKAEQQLLTKEITQKRKYIQFIEGKTYKKHLYIANKIKPETWINQSRRIACILEQENKLVATRHQKKIEFWLQKDRIYKNFKVKNINNVQNNVSHEETITHLPDGSSCTEGTGYINYSKRTLTNTEKITLNHGPKHVFGKLPNSETIIADTEKLANNIKNEYKELLKKEIVQTVAACSNKQPIFHTRILKNLKRDKNIVFLKADKSPKIVIIDKEEYTTKTKEVINEIQAIEIHEDPTENALKDIRNLKNRKYLPDELKSACHPPPYPTVPHMFLQIKVHKDNRPLRPLVAKYQSPLYNLEKALATMLSPLIIHNQNTVKNTNDLIQNLKIINSDINNSTKLVSLDVKSLFPSVNPNLAKQIILKKLKEKNSFDFKQLKAIEKALNIVIMNNFFTLENKIYKQTKGCPMGSPLSPLFAEVIMQEIEDSTFHTSKYKPILYKRYVDDCLVIYNDQEAFQNFFLSLNTSMHDIKFTIESAKDNALPYLDILIQIVSNKIEYKVYRKPTSNISPILPTSVHPTQHKMAVFRAHIRRAYVNSSTATARNEELEYIKTTISKAGYQENIFYKINNKIRRQMFPVSKLTPVFEPKKETKFISVAYHPDTSKIYSKFKKFSDYNLRIAYKTSPNIQNLLAEKTKTQAQSGIYFIPIRDDSDGGRIKVYIGQTIRPVSHRIKEHAASLSSLKQQTAFSLFINENIAQPLWNDVQIICTPKSENITYSEALHIIKNKKYCINKNTPIEISNIWHTIISKENQKSPVLEYIFSQIFSNKLETTTIPKGWLHFCQHQRDGATVVMSGPEEEAGKPLTSDSTAAGVSTPIDNGRYLLPKLI